MARRTRQIGDTVAVQPRASEAGTHVTWRIALRGGRGQRLLYALAGRRMRRMIEANLDALTAFVDQPATRTRSASGAS